MVSGILSSSISKTSYWELKSVLKISFDLDKVLKEDPLFPKDSYYTYKNIATTVGTVGASIFASNVVTPILRNNMASRMQKKYIDNREKFNPYSSANSTGMKI